MSEREAHDLVDTVDLERADFIGTYFKVEWPSRSIYQAMINTSMGDETVVRTILDVMNTLNFRMTAKAWGQAPSRLPNLRSPYCLCAAASFC